MVKRLLCAWWAKGKYHRGFRYQSLKALRESLKTFQGADRHIYLHLGTIPMNAKPQEIDRFLRDIQRLLKEKFQIEGGDVEL